MRVLVGCNLHDGSWKVEDHIQGSVGSDLLIADTAVAFEKDFLVDDLILFDDQPKRHSRLTRFA